MVSLGYSMDVAAPFRRQLEDSRKGGSPTSRTLTTMVGLRRSSINILEAPYLLSRESGRGSSSWQLLFNDASDVGVRMPDLDRVASE